MYADRLAVRKGEIRHKNADAKNQEVQQKNAHPQLEDGRTLFPGLSSFITCEITESCTHGRGNVPVAEPDVRDTPMGCIAWLF